MQSSRMNLSKYILVTIIFIFLISMTVYLTTSYRVVLPTITDQTGNDVIQVRVQGDTPLDNDDIYVDDTEARKIFNEVKIFCWILTTKSGVVSKAAGVNATWAQRCNKHFFFASAYGEETVFTPSPLPPNVTLPPKVEIDFSSGERKEHKTANGETFATITMGDVVFIDTPEGYFNLTEKSREVLQYLYLNEVEHYDWFLKADDDTYVIVENLRYYLKGLQPNKPAYLGYQLEPAWFDSPYMSGGAGYVFNKAGLKLLIEKGIQMKGTCLDKGSFEDLEVGRCAVRAGVNIYSTLDRFDRETFHPDNINEYLPGPPPQWLYYYARNKPKGGSECCSQLSITFHRMTTRDMLVFDHLLYKTVVYGRRLTGSLPDFYRYNRVKKLPNGVPTMKTL